MSTQSEYLRKLQAEAAARTKGRLSIKRTEQSRDGLVVASETLENPAQLRVLTGLLNGHTARFLSQVSQDETLSFPRSVELASTSLNGRIRLMERLLQAGFIVPETELIHYQTESGETVNAVECIGAEVHRCILRRVPGINGMIPETDPDVR